MDLEEIKLIEKYQTTKYKNKDSQQNRYKNPDSFIELVINVDGNEYRNKLGGSCVYKSGLI